MKAIYYPGEANIQSTIRRHDDGIERVDYTNKTTEEYLEELRERYPNKPEPLVLGFEEAFELVQAAQREKYLSAWTEITEEQWMDALEILPPEKWRTVAGVEIFRCMEYLTGSITAHYARIAERFFSANRCTSTSYEVIASEVYAATQETQTA